MRVRATASLLALGVLSVGCGDGVGATEADSALPAQDAEVDAALDAELVPAPDANLPDAAPEVDAGFAFNLPEPNWPRPPVPLDNPMSVEKAELGRHLFYDERLSKNGAQSCASCHKQELAFADERAHGLGSTGEEHPRGSMSLANVGYAQTLTWANPLMTTLERQVHVPLFGDHPVELGNTSIPELEATLQAVPRYTELFAAAFPDEAQPIHMLNVARALATFQRTLISGNSAYDRYNRGDEGALSASAKRGMSMVTTNEDHRFECNHCHGGTFFSDHVTWEGRSALGGSPPYHQTGLYDIDGKGGYPAPNTGIHDVTLLEKDMGKFKAPSLRNIALTAPYMHDGSIATLSEVLDHYAAGGRAKSFGKTDPLLAPFPLLPEEKADIIAFLESLTDEAFISDPRYSDPWTAETNP